MLKIGKGTGGGPKESSEEAERGEDSQDKQVELKKWRGGEKRRNGSKNGSRESNVMKKWSKGERGHCRNRL